MKRRIILSVAVAVLMGVGFLGGPLAWAGPIGPGFDLLTTPPGGAFLPDDSPFPGLPLVSLPIDPRIGNTDTIVERKAGLSAGGTIPAEIVALSLKSVSPVSIGDSFFDVFVTLDNRQSQPNNNGNQIDSLVNGGKLNPSTGVLEIRTHDDGAGGGTFDSFFDVFTKITLKEVGGDRMTQEFRMDRIASTGSSWSHTRPPGYPAEGTEFNLPDGDPVFVSGNFFPGPIQHTGPHPHTDPCCRPEKVPEPSTLLLLGSGLAGLGAAAWRRRRQ